MLYIMIVVLRFSLTAYDFVKSKVMWLTENLWFYLMFWGIFFLLLSTKNG